MKALFTVPMNRPIGKRVPKGLRYPEVNDNGLGYVAAAAKAAGADATVWSWNVNMSTEAFRRELLRLRPDLVGVKVFTTQFRLAHDTLRVVRDMLPEVVTVIGGPHPSASRPQDLFEEFGGILDYAVQGDGEHAISGLAKQISSAGGRPGIDALRQIPGLVYRDGNDVKRNAPFFGADLDSLPKLDWSLQQPSWFRPSGPPGSGNTAWVDDSRGCPADCGFCKCGLINGHLPRHRSVDTLCDEVGGLTREYGVGFVVFTGNAFMSNVDYVKELCDRLSRLERPIQWLCTGAAYERHFRDAELLQLMRRAGCTTINLGVESGSPRVKASLAQPTALETIREVVPLIVQAGIAANGFFMFGFPDETVAEMHDTVRFALSVPFSSLSFCICLPLPGTSSYEGVLARHGLTRIDWNGYDLAHPRLLPCAASVHQVRYFNLLGKVLTRSRVARRIYDSSMRCS